MIPVLFGFAALILLAGLLGVLLLLEHRSAVNLRRRAYREWEFGFKWGVHDGESRGYSRGYQDGLSQHHQDAG